MADKLNYKGHDDFSAKGITDKHGRLSLRLTSPEFADGTEMPWSVSAANENRLPTLNIHDTPEATVSLTLVLEDLSSPLGIVTHWLAWNLPPQITHIDALHFPKEAIVGISTFGKIGYMGPIPPEGTHTYRFIVHALDCELSQPSGAPRSAFDAAVAGHIIDRAELRGILQRA